MNIKGTQTEKNIRASLQGESMARNKYTYYAIQARNEGLHDTANFFERMADNEKEHAKIWFKLLNDGLGTTEKNLMDASAGESFEWTNMYPSFAKQAREDGLDMIATMFEKIAAIEKDHDAQFLKELGRLKKAPEAEEEQEEELQEVAVHRCQFCGYVHEDSKGAVPTVCPVCEAIGSWNEGTILK